MLKYECLGSDPNECKRLKMNLISCYSSHLVDPGLFPDWNILYSNNDIYPSDFWY